MEGGIVSNTVTLDAAEDEFPVASQAVRVTTLTPASSQSNALKLIAKESIPQLSALPLFNCEAAIFASPLASR